jgi:hypothetical protein
VVHKKGVQKCYVLYVKNLSKGIFRKDPRVIISVVGLVLLLLIIRHIRNDILRVNVSTAGNP